MGFPVPFYFLMKKSALFFLSIIIIAFFSCDVVRPLLMSDADEIALGNKLKAQILADTLNYPRYHGNDSVISYINQMGQTIADAQKDRDTFPFTFTIIKNDSTINAFSIPGGHVFVYTGLLKAASNGAEVAGVVAHERSLTLRIIMAQTGFCSRME
jgi:predicted Zn-dependent protease